MKKLFLLPFLLIITISTSLASNPSNLGQDLEDLVKNYKSTHHLNAIFQVAQNGTALATGASGYFDIQGNKPLLRTDTMPIASGTKQMTAASILILEEMGKLSTEDTIAKHLDEKNEFWPEGKMPEWAKQITIHQLLTHTSGLAEYVLQFQPKIDGTHKSINKQIVKYATEKGLQFKPGEKFSYCNTGYVFLGLIIEKASGKDLANFFKSNLFNPLNMKNTKLSSLKEAIDFQLGKLAKYPQRYFVVLLPNSGPNFVKAEAQVKYMLVPYADGGVVSNLDDMQLWLDGLHGGKLLSAKSYEKMTKGYLKTEDKFGLPTHVGYGLYICDLPNGHKMITHSGNALAIRGEYSYFPQTKISISILSNIMVHVPDEVKDKVSFEDDSNQYDIAYFKAKLIDFIVKHAELQQAQL